MPVQRSLLVIGGTSDIGRATALCYAQAGWRIFFAARDPDAARRRLASRNFSPICAIAWRRLRAMCT